MVINYADIYSDLTKKCLFEMSDREVSMSDKLEEWFNNDPRLFSTTCKSCEITLLAVDMGGKKLKLECPLCNAENWYKKSEIEYLNQ